MGIPVPDTGSVTEDDDVGGVLTTSGDINYLLGGDAGEWTAETITGSFGSQLVIDADGNWTYTADNSNAAIQALDTGETLTEVFTVTSNNGTSTVTITINGEDEPPCFVSGTLIDTPLGRRPVEDLCAGDQVLTRDHGVQEICWAGRRTIDLRDPKFAAAFAPVRLIKHSLAPGVPDRDILISPMHRVLVRDPAVSLFTGLDEALCPVVHLVNGKTILREDVDRVTYHHLLFREHEVLLSHNCPSESFYPGPVGLNGFADQARDEVLAIFPELRSFATGYGQPARPVLKRFEAILVSDRLTKAWAQVA
ncbi:MAG: Hint domain-containing protein [Pseudomonadota bacterium]